VTESVEKYLTSKSNYSAWSSNNIIEMDNHENVDLAHVCPFLPKLQVEIKILSVSSLSWLYYFRLHRVGPSVYNCATQKRYLKNNVFAFGISLLTDLQAEI